MEILPIGPLEWGKKQLCILVSVYFYRLQKGAKLARCRSSCRDKQTLILEVRLLALLVVFSDLFPLLNIDWGVVIRVYLLITVMGMMNRFVCYVQLYSLEENESSIYSRALKGGISCCFSDCLLGEVSNEASSLLLKLPESDSVLRYSIRYFQE